MPKPIHKVLGPDGKPHRMTLERSNGTGVGNFSNVTKSMPHSELQHIRNKAQQVAYEAKQRSLILQDPFRAIAEAVLGEKGIAAKAGR